MDARSERNLEGVHADLATVVRRARTRVSFIVTEGVRTLARQQALFHAGASKTMDSRHLTGHAVDVAALVTGEVRWDWPLYSKIADAMKDEAAKAGIAIVWGGDWKSFRDGPHFELSRTEYPKEIK